MKKWPIILISVLVIISIIGYLLPQSSGNVAVVELNGVISATSAPFSGVRDSAEIVDQLNSAEKNTDVEAIVLAINSPGGSPVASEEIMRAVRESDKLIVAYIRDIGASGAYWVASAADQVFASPVSLVGSVGVNSAYLEFSGLIEEYNVSYVDLKAGEYKDIGSPFKKMSSEERARLEEKLDLMHTYFLESVAQNRELSEEDKSEIAKADFYTGLQAKKINLVDSFGGEKEAISYVENELNISASLISYQTEPSLLSVLTSMKQQNFYRGILSPIPELR